MSVTVERQAPGFYLTTEVRDKHGLSYIIYREHGEWILCDSRGREVSRHTTLHDAKESI